MRENPRRNPVAGKRHTSFKRRSESVAGRAVAVGSQYTLPEHDYTYGKADVHLVVEIWNSIVESEIQAERERKMRRARQQAESNQRRKNAEKGKDVSLRATDGQ